MKHKELILKFRAGAIVMITLKPYSLLYNEVDRYILTEVRPDYVKTSHYIGNRKYTGSRTGNILLAATIIKISLHIDSNSTNMFNNIELMEAAR